jgi:chromosome segregation ATPase
VSDYQFARAEALAAQLAEARRSEQLAVEHIAKLIGERNEAHARAEATAAAFENLETRIEAMRAERNAEYERAEAAEQAVSRYQGERNEAHARAEVAEWSLDAWRARCKDAEARVRKLRELVDIPTRLAVDLAAARERIAELENFGRVYIEKDEALLEKLKEGIDIAKQMEERIVALEVWGRQAVELMSIGEWGSPELIAAGRALGLGGEDA